MPVYASDTVTQCTVQEVVNYEKVTIQKGSYVIVLLGK